MTIETESGEVICTRRLSSRADCLDITRVAYKYDSKRLLAPRVPLGFDGGIAAFTRRIKNGDKHGVLYLEPGKILLSILMDATKVTLRVVSHASYIKRTFTQFVADEKRHSEFRAAHAMPSECIRKRRRRPRLAPYNAFKKQRMEIWTQWDERGHCVGLFRPYCENLTHKPASERPYGVERMWGRFEVVPTTCYPLVKVTPHIIENYAALPSHETYTCHPSLSIMDIAEVAMSASRGRYMVYERNCQTFLLDTYEDERVGLGEYASQFNNMLRAKGVQTPAKTDQRSTEHYSIEPFPDKGPLEYCGPELCMVGCGGRGGGGVGS